MGSTMVDEIAEKLGVSNSVAVLVIGLVAIQILLQLGALIHLARRPAGAVSPNRWMWVVVILLGNALGAIIYLAVARSTPTPALDPLYAAPGEAGDARTRAQRAADTLYGARERDS